MILPELDLQPFLEAPESPAAAGFVRKLRETCHGPGFCYLVGHGVPAEMEAAVLEAAHAFFALPIEERRALAIANSPHFRGYTELGGERTRGAADWREQLDLGPEEPAETLGPAAPPWRRLRGPNQWPASLPGMRPTILEWMREMDRVGLAVLRALALGLGLEREHFDAAVLPRGDPHMKISRYPAQREGADTGQGLGLHNDSGLVSFVLQDGVGGLEVQVGGRLLAVDPRPGSYVMNLGEMLQAATAGYLRATKHRVVSPPAGRERLSLAYFYHPRLECVFEPVALPPELAEQAPGGANPDPDDPIFARFGENYLKIRLRSHPDAALRHYADVTTHNTLPNERESSLRDR